MQFEEQKIKNEEEKMRIQRNVGLHWAYQNMHNGNSRKRKRGRTEKNIQEQMLKKPP